MPEICVDNPNKTRVHQTGILTLFALKERLTYVAEGRNHKHSRLKALVVLRSCPSMMPGFSRIEDRSDRSSWLKGAINIFLGPRITGSVPAFGSSQNFCIRPTSASSTKIN